jgi:hypothetical protein
MKVFVLSTCAMIELDWTLWALLNAYKDVPGSLVGYAYLCVHPMVAFLY